MDTLSILRDRAETGSSEDRDRLLQNGAAFAAMTIQNQTDGAERAFVAWLAEGRPVDGGKAIQRLNYWRQVSRRISSVMALPAGTADTLRDLPAREREEAFARQTWGFGPAKSCFSLACAGIGDQACMDSHLLRRYVNEAVQVKGFLAQRDLKMEWGHKDQGKQRFARYFRLADLVFGGPLDCADHAAAQWAEWLAKLDRPGHPCLVEGAVA